MKFKAYVQEKGFAGALHLTHNAKLPANEHDPLDATVPAEKAQMVALEQNGKAVRAMISAISKPKDMNKIMTEQRHDATNQRRKC